MKLFFSIFIFLTCMLCNTGCSIEKRVYNRGYHITWKSPIRSKSATDHSIEKTQETDLTRSFEDKRDDKGRESHHFDGDSVKDPFTGSEKMTIEEDEVKQITQPIDGNLKRENLELKSVQQVKDVSKINHIANNSHSMTNLIFGVLAVLFILFGTSFMFVGLTSFTIIGFFLGILGYFCLILGLVFLILFIISWLTGMGNVGPKLANEKDDSIQNSKSQEEIEEEEFQHNKRTGIIFIALLLIMMGVIFIPNLYK